MSSWRPPRKARWIDLTPLIDVVVTLLIVVLLAAHFDRLEALPVALPEREAASESLVRAATVTLDASGQLFLDGQPLSESELKASVAARVLEAPKATFVLNGDRTIPYGEVFRILDLLETAGATEVGLSYAGP